MHQRKERPPIDASELRALALAYVARYLTSQAKLDHYLRRKLRERGWADEGDPPIAAMVQHCAALGFVDDSGFATAKTASLARRGFGSNRIRAALKGAGVSDTIIAQANCPSEDVARQIALAFVRRKRIGGYATKPATPDQRRKWIATLMNAGHGYALARELAWQDPFED
ncbi:MAG: hypothetical protein RL367_223 [Pseudomonadota bacterium]